MSLSLRIIRDGARDSAFNMAADRYLLDKTPELNAVFLRLYAWNPPAVSLGCLQKAAGAGFAAGSLDEVAMKAEGVKWVVRPTGGRAVLHWNDLTYAFVFPANLREMGRTISESYSVISQCLIRGLALAGIPSETHDSSIEYSATARNLRLPCFLSPNRSEIMVQGKKLVGSAQKRTPQAVLQHGSIPLDGSFRRLPEFLSISQEERTRQRRLLEKKCICVNEVNPAVDYEKLSACLIKGFTETLPFPAFEYPWGKEEIDEIQLKIKR